MNLGDQFVASQTAPSRQILADGRLRGTDFQQPAWLQRIDILTDQKQQAAAAVEIAAVEACIRFVRML